jgi:hypothetical protein
MNQTITVTGHMTGPTNIELDEPLVDACERVRVTIEPLRSPTEPEVGLADFVRSLPPGTRTKADIDRQIQQERDSWGDR